MFKFVSAGQYTPLHRAAMNCHVETAQLLVEKGADISIKDNDGVSQ